MGAHAPRLPFSLDPLMAETKRRAKRRRLLLVVTAVVVTASVTAGWFAFHSAGRGIFCAQPQSGWHVRSVHHFGRTDLVLTNFRFGNPADNNGLLDAHLPWPQDGAMIAVLSWNVGAFKRPLKVARRLYVRRSQFVFSGGAPHWITSRLVRYRGRDTLYWVELRALTPAALAGANRALAAVRLCSKP